LLAVSPAGEVRVLAAEAGGEPIRFANDVDVAADGTLYFTDTSSRFPLEHSDLDFIEHRGTGRLLALAPDGQVRVVATGLHYPNGIAVGPGSRFVVVTESTEYRVRRFWLGARTGESDVFIDNLPGFPTGISSNGRDRFWLALAFPRIALFDALLPRPFLRKVVFRLPDVLKPAPARHALALGLDLEGRVVANLQDDSPDAYAPLTSVEEHGGFLYLAGGFQERWQPSIARIAVPVE
jgi:sugar lactone lactonase YvrE